MAKSAAERVGKSAGQQLLSILLVGVVPVLVSLAMVWAAFQFVLKVPVWQDAMKILHHKSAAASQSTTGSKTASTGTQTEIVKLKTQLATLQTKESSLTSKLSNDAAAMAKLQGENKNLHHQLSQQLSKESQAQTEASVLQGMDPSAAAQVMAKLPLSAAAAVIAVMQSSESGPILGQMPPATASKLLTLASKVQFPASGSATGAGTANSVNTTNGSGTASGNATGSGSGNSIG
ncbi:MotE family protein [Alicyclobacillus sp. SO9]|uniref:MotE family protein n=1 Tax=Alicyclobacillus sp. SO9 TaxID=2665646 RepID=UPI0018E8A221|nr:hypothetical protein [Alicyclobacillus sp. SO9]QQE80807.1 hypothetical protein GI364_10730 [Alicyclobacillus sp. SO9]